MPICNNAIKNGGEEHSIQQPKKKKSKEVQKKRKKMIHFSHPHELELWGEIGSESVYQSSLLILPVCSCCKLPSSPEEPMYYCVLCNYSLHFGCAQCPQLINHPGHRNHTLALLPTSAYPGGAFNCDACNRPGNGFSYHCSSCEFDLHVTCASKPFEIALPSHPCPLELTFKNPYDNAKGFSCDVCLKIGMKEWLYRCGACEFDVHMDCAATAAAAGVVHGGQARTLHAAGMGYSSQSHPQALMRPHQMMNPMAQSQLRPGNAAAQEVVHEQAVRPGVVHGGKSRQLGNINVPAPSGQSGLTNIPVIQGPFEGDTQGVGQGLIGGGIGGSGGGGGSHGGRVGGGAESSIMGNVFGDSPAQIRP